MYSSPLRISQVVMLEPGSNFNSPLVWQQGKLNIAWWTLKSICCLCNGLQRIETPKPDAPFIGRKIPAPMITTFSHLLLHCTAHKQCFIFLSSSSDASVPTGKGNYWILDPNCEKMFDNGNFRRKRKKKCDNPGRVTEPSEKLDDKSNVKFLRSDSLVGTPESKMKSSPQSSPALDTSPCFANFTSAMNAVMSNGASNKLTADLSPSKRYFTGLSSYPINNYHYNSLQPGDSVAQANLRLRCYPTKQSSLCSSLVNPLHASHMLYNQEAEVWRGPVILMCFSIVVHFTC